MLKAQAEAQAKAAQAEVEAMGLAEADKEPKPEVEPAEVEVLLEKEPIPDIAEPIAASPREGKITRGSVVGNGSSRG